MRTFGTLKISTDKKYWGAFNLEPHVAIAFKRLFPRVDKRKSHLQLTDSDAIRADLHWFMQRYPLDYSDNVGKLLRKGVKRDADRAAERGKILLPDWTPRAVGFKDGKQPYLYQSQAAEIAIRNPGLLLGDDLGLGKTISCLALLCGGAPLPAAVVVEPHLAIQWAMRIEEFTDLQTHIIQSRTPYDLPKTDVYVFSYTNIIGWNDVLAKGFIRTVAYDEIQQLRTGQESAKGSACKVLSDRSDLSLGLSATPIFNYGDEIWEIMNFIKPDLLGDWEEFQREWCGLGTKVSDPDALGSYLHSTGYFLRRTEYDDIVDASLPPLNVLDITVEWDDRAVADDMEIAKKLALQVLSGSFVQRGQAARELDNKIRQATGIAKARGVAAYINMLLQSVPNVIVGGWHREVYSIWLEALKHHNPVMYTGTESAAGKNRSKNMFISGESRVLIMSLRSGAGLDGLQDVCQDAVIGELDWSPMVHKQFIGRVRRPGQLYQCTAHYVTTDDGSDPVLVETLGIKSNQARGIVDPGKAIPSVDRDDSRIKKLAESIIAADVMGR